MSAPRAVVTEGLVKTFGATRALDGAFPVLWPLVRYDYSTHNLDLPTPAPSRTSRA